MIAPALLLCGLLGAAPDLDTWSRTLIQRSASTPIFLSITRARDAAQTAAALGSALPPLALTLGVEHGEPGSALGVLSRSDTQLIARGANYFPFGANLTTGLSAGFVPYAAPGLDVTFSVDVLRDRAGRYTRLQRRSATLAAQSSGELLRAQQEAAVEELLGAGLDACVQQQLVVRTGELLTQVQAGLQTVEQRTRVGLARESDVLQFRNNVLLVQRNLSDLEASRDTVARAFAVTYGNTLSLDECPALLIDPTKTSEVFAAAGEERFERAPDLASNELHKQQVRDDLSLRALDLQPNVSAYARVTGGGPVTVQDTSTSPTIVTGGAWRGIVGAQLTWEYGNTPGRLRRQLAEVTVAQADVQQEQARLSLKAQLLQSAIEMQGLQATLTLLDQQRATAQEILRLQKTRYEIGGVSAFELSNSYQTIIQLETIPPSLLSRWRKLYWHALVLLGRLSAEAG